MECYLALVLCSTLFMSHLFFQNSGDYFSDSFMLEVFWGHVPVVQIMYCNYSISAHNIATTITTIALLPYRNESPVSTHVSFLIYVAEIKMCGVMTWLTSISLHVGPCWSPPLVAFIFSFSTQMPWRKKLTITYCLSGATRPGCIWVNGWRSRGVNSGNCSWIGRWNAHARRVQSEGTATRDIFKKPNQTNKNVPRESCSISTLNMLWEMNGYVCGWRLGKR